MPKSIFFSFLLLALMLNGTVSGQRNVPPTSPGDRTRWSVAKAMQQFPQPAAIHATYYLLDDPHPTVRNMAALSMSIVIIMNFQSLGSFRDTACKKLTDKFSSYNDSYRGSDAEWGWRCIGEALQRLGECGTKALNDFLRQTQDRTLADHAWRILYVQQSGYVFIPTTPEQAEQEYKQYPPTKK